MRICGFEPFVDRHSTAGGEEWQRRLGNLIVDADTIVFILSPASAISEVCGWEVNEALRLNKRILPVLCRPLLGAARADLIVVSRDTSEFIAAGVPVFDPWDWALHAGGRALAIADADGPNALAKATALLSI